MSTITLTPTTTRAARAAVVGGVLWALVPLAFGLVDAQNVQRGTLAFVGVAAVFWICGAASLALLLMGMRGLHAELGARPGRLGTTGIVVSTVGLAAMLLGNGTEIATVTFAGKESDLGHSVFLIGFLVLVVGSVLLGITVYRRRLSRAAGLIMALALPIGVVLLVLGSVLAPNSDVGFWAAITVPTGVAWIVLGRSMTAAGRTAPALDAARV